jgi:hypothetical protein
MTIYAWRPLTHGDAMLRVNPETQPPEFQKGIVIKNIVMSLTENLSPPDQPNKR